MVDVLYFARIRKRGEMYLIIVTFQASKCFNKNKKGEQGWNV
jgi:hypothetical protein